MKARPALGEPCYAAEGLSGAAAPPIMERLPPGRLFSAISTLRDISAERQDDCAAKTGQRRADVQP